MIDDLRELPRGSTINADICVIGAGAAGITIAQELAASALSVCLVEGGGLEFEQDTQDLYAGENVGIPVAFQGGRLRFFGGSTNHWGGRCAPLDPIDFRQRDWVPHSGWPIDRAELDPYYVRARTIAGFRAPWLSDADTLSSYLNITLPPLNGDWMKPFLWHWVPSTKEFGAWNWGRVYRKTLQDSRNVRVLLHANPTVFSANEDRTRMRSVKVATLNGVTATIQAKHFVISCGGIENARLLLLAAEQNSGGFGNQHDLVGRHFLQNAHGDSGLLVGSGHLTRLQEQFNILIGPDGLDVEVGLTLSPLVQEQQRLLNCSAILQFIGDPESGVTAAQDIWRALLNGAWAPEMGEKAWRIANDMSSVGQTVARRLSRGHSLQLEGSEGVPSRSAKIVLNIEQAPNPDSRITLSAERDALGLRMPKVDWRLGEAERRTAAAFTKLIGTEFARLGIGRCQLEPWLEDASVELGDWLPDYYHYIGTTRMADDPREGVVDRNCSVHGMSNLSVAGSSVFTTAGHVHPTYTIIALALRLADHLKQM